MSRMSQVMHAMSPNTWHNGAVNLLSRGTLLSNPIARKGAKILGNSLTAFTGAAATIKEAGKTVVSLPVAVITGVPLAVARFVKPTFMQSAEEYRPTLSSTWSTAKKTGAQAIGTLASWRCSWRSPLYFKSNELECSLPSLYGQYYNIGRIF